MQYDPFQLQAIAAIDSGKSVLVCAPTGAGKTAIAEYAINKALANNERVVYTAPIKALSNQKYRDFSKLYPDKVGLLTGDVTINAHAPIAIMTTEIYRNRLFEDHEHLQTTSWIIFDEVHYLDDHERGTVWEEAIMFSPKHVKFLALSATAPNINEVAEWINGTLGYPLEVVVENNRPVPLVNLFQCQNVIYADPRILRKEGYLDYDVWPSRFDRGRRGNSQNRHRGNTRQFLRAKLNRTDDLINHIEHHKQMPCLYFAFGRKRAEQLAWDQRKFNFLTDTERDQIVELYTKLCEKYELQKEGSALDMRALVERGIAFHHAGMLPTLKEVIEQLFASKLIKLIFTTETFALGINMPAKSVVFDDLKKFNGTHFGYLRTRDYYQMAGRAGRRGMDKEGYVYLRLDPHEVQHSAMLRIIYGKPESIESQFNSCYATLLNLYDQLGARLIEVYPRSFHYFQSNKKIRQEGQHSIDKKIGLLMDLGHIQGDKVTDKGYFASWMYGYELVLSQMLEEGYLETLDKVQLSVLLCSLVFEPRKNQFEPRLGDNLMVVEKKALGFLMMVHKKEIQHKIHPLTKQPFFHLGPALEAWIAGTAFSQLAEHTDVDEGEIIRYFRMTIQLLRQLKLAPGVTQKLRTTAGDAIKRINRDLVDAEKQLRA